MPDSVSYVQLQQDKYKLCILPSLRISNSSIAAQTDETCSRPAPTDSDRSDVISLAAASVRVLMLLTIPEACARMEHSFHLGAITFYRGVLAFSLCGINELAF
ncbi:hypothetical protein P8452_57511 [Trifolium repens]|nr:hypothetical protein P8452_57511 [Trifolium repens]